ncbi:MAG: hemagglutinin [Mucilaginibacter sp.]|nr:hemagglutinin [Mucilaginibacter sp.]
MKKLILIVTLLVSSLAVSAQNTSQSYIEKFKDNAIRIMHETGVPASIILAAAMHESANGNSSIAKKLNNQFGVKGYNTHVYVNDHNKKIRTAYKKYDSVMDSFQDFARIMTERKQFSHLSETLSHYDYLSWAKGIQRSGYCSSHKWASQVLAIIHKYQLNAFDENPADQKQLAANAQ